MKTLTIALAALALSAAPLTAQDRTIHGGPLVGASSATITGDNQEDTGSRTGLIIGGFARTAWTDRLALRGELLYASKGASYPDNDATLAISYLQVPLLAEYRLGAAGASIAPFLLAGPSFALKAGCTLTADEHDFECNDNTTQVSGGDLGFILGAGVENERMHASLRYDLSLSNANGSGAAVVHNRAITLLVGYSFRLGSR